MSSRVASANRAPVWPSPVKRRAIAFDLIAVTAAMVLAVVARAALPGSSPEVALDQHMAIGLASLPVWLVSFARHRLYHGRTVQSRLREFKGLVASATESVLAMSVMAFFFKEYVTRGWLLLTLVAAIPLLTLERELVRQWIRRARERGRMLRKVVVVGANREAVAMASMLMDDPALGYWVMGYVDDGGGRDAVDEESDLPVLGTLDETLIVLQASGASGVIIATTALDYAHTNRLARDLAEQGFYVELSSSLLDIAPERLTVGALGRFPVIAIDPLRRDGWRAKAKRAVDVAIAGTGLLLVSPLLAAIAVAVKLDSAGPVLFRQSRVGQHGLPFEVLKFRSMVTDAESKLIDLRQTNEAGGPLFKMENDPRVTRVGRVLRKLSLDELPQLWNVVKGEMSLVGPRPCLASEMVHWPADLHNRLRVKPGITGMWQVSRGEDWDFDDYSRHDLYYVDNWSPLTDLAIALKTIPSMFLRGNK